MKNKTLSVVIPTSGKRVNEIVLTLRTILKSKKDFLEIIVINQGSVSFEKKVLKSVSFDKKIRWYNQKKRGKSKALNFAVTLIKGDIFVIVDDDVVVSKNCFKVISNEFNNDVKLSVLLGQVKPYGKIKDGFFCPSLSNFSKRRQLTLDKLFTIESQTAGAIMAIGMSVLKKNGGFCEWLGPGAYLGGGDDWEYIYRLVKIGKKVLMSTDLVVYHNKFINRCDYYHLTHEYYISTMIFCFYLTMRYGDVSFVKSWNLFSRVNYQKNMGWFTTWTEIVVGFLKSIFFYVRFLIYRK